MLAIAGYKIISTNR